MSGISTSSSNCLPKFCSKLPTLVRSPLTCRHCSIRTRIRYRVRATFNRVGLIRRKNRALDRATAAGRRGLGRPPAGRREHRVRFWEAIARGASSENAAVEAGVLPSIGVRWFRKGGGMPPLTLAPVSGRYLSFTQREEIAVLL